MKRVLSFVVVLLMLSGFAGLAFATPAMTPRPNVPPVTPVVPIAEQLGQQLQALVAPQTPADNDEANAEPAPTFGTRALNLVIAAADILGRAATQYAENFAALPQISGWLEQQKSDPRYLARWQAVWADLIYVVGLAFLAGLVLEGILFPARQALRRAHAVRWHSKLATVVGLFTLRGLPIIVFVALAVMLLDQAEAQKWPRFVVMNIVYALALVRMAVSVLRGVFSPKHEHLRFLPLSTAQAVYGFRWLSSLAVIVIGAYFVIELAQAARMPDAAIAAFINLTGLALVVIALVVIIQKRAFVAHFIRGNLSAAQPDLSWIDSLRLWFARRWHVLAMAYLIIGYAIAALGVKNGLALMLRGTVLTLTLLAGLRLMLRQFALWEAQSPHRATPYIVLRGMFLRVALWIVVLAGIALAWGVNLSATFATPFGARVMGALFSIGVTTGVLGFVYELFTGTMNKYLNRKQPDGTVVEASARARTLLPMIRNTLFVIFAAVVGIVMLAEAGFNIAPLLAGAGVLGVAVGFGSQALVKDFLTGLFIVLENTIAVGDAVKIGEHAGTVEAMSMRTLRLRDLDGALHILPFSEVTKFINQTKDFSFALMKVSVATETDLDKALTAFRAVGDALRHDPDYSHRILDDVEILGVDSLNNSSVTLVARMRAVAGQQWAVRRMFLLRLKQRFDQEGIELSSPTAVKLVGASQSQP